MATAPAARTPAAAGATARGSSGSLRRLTERLFLGSIMALIAIVIDRRLRRVFIRKI